jgi:vacuolar-type H+-ATPase subunit E/Vma4
MGYKELIEALQKEGEEKLNSIRREAEDECNSIRKETSERIERIREEWRNTQAVAVREWSETILDDARKKAGLLILAAQEELSVRLYRVAVRDLSRLRESGYDEIFGGLVNELPAAQWHVVRVNPEDEKMAKQYFRDAEIICDGNIAGGLDVTDNGGTFRVINTFEKRLENMWSHILPELIKDVYREIPVHGVSEKDRGEGISC